MPRTQKILREKRLPSNTSPAHLRGNKKPSAFRSTLEKIVGAHRSFLVDTQTLLSVVPVILVGNDRKIATHPLLDPGREVTLIQEDMARDLGLALRLTSIRTSTFHGRDPPMKLKEVNFRISTEDNSLNISVENALTVPRLNVSGRMLNWALLKADWPHLAIVEPANMQPEQATVIIEKYVEKAHDYSETRRAGKPHLAPCTKLTRFDWTMIGKMVNRCLLSNSNRQRRVNLVRRSTSNDELIEAL